MRRPWDARLKHFRLSPHPSAQACLALAALLALPVSHSFAKSSSGKRKHAAAAYDNALRLKAELEARRPPSRTYKDYLRVARAFDAVYRADPGYSKTPLAIAAEGALYQEMGHVLGNERYYESAVASYRFLADQYGGAVAARNALFTVAEIYRVDLGNPEEAAKAYTEYLTRYPYAENVPQARRHLSEMNHREAAEATEAAEASQRPAANSVTTSAPQETEPSQNQALPQGRLLEVNDVRFWEGSSYTRIVISVEDEAKFQATRLYHPDRIVFDLPGTRLSRALKGKSFPVGNGFLQQIRVAQFQPDSSRVVLDIAKIEDYSVFTLPNPFRLIIDIRGPSQVLLARSPPPSYSHAPAVLRNAATGAGAAAPSVPAGKYSTAAGSSKQSGAPDEDPNRAPTVASVPGRAPKAPQTEDNSADDEATGTGSDASAAVDANLAPPESSRAIGIAQPSAQTSSGSSTLTRALGLKIARIVIDPGHGGHDTGTIGPDGLEEKNVVLDVGLRLRKLIRQRMGSEVVMTRSDDTFIPLEERTAIANQRAADLFISIHANASRDPSARGIEVYYLNFTSDPSSLEVAARENATSQESVHQLQGLLKKIALTEKIEESDEFARQVDQSLEAATARSGNEQPDRGLKKAPFVVLIGANMPSILAEISFLTNPRDEHLMSESNYRQQIAEGLYRGIARYVANLGSVKIAERRASLPDNSK